jgi:hypothetical protein
MLMSKQTINNEANTVKVATNNLAKGMYLINVVQKDAVLYRDKIILIK